MDTGFGGKRKEKLGLSGHSVACTTTVLAVRGSLRKSLEINRMKIVNNSYSSNIFLNDYLKKIAGAFGAHLSGLTFIIKIIRARAHFGQRV